MTEVRKIQSYQLFPFTYQGRAREFNLSQEKFSAVVTTHFLKICTRTSNVTTDPLQQDFVREFGNEKLVATLTGEYT